MPGPTPKLMLALSNLLRRFFNSGKQHEMTIFKRGAGALVAAVFTLTLGVSSVAAAGATVETFPLDARWSHEEPDGHVFWFDVTGTVRIVTAADGRQSATVTMREEQTLYDPTGKLVMVAESASTQHSLTIGENEFQVHLNSRSSWTNEYGGGSLKSVLQIVDGVVLVFSSR
jgi:hypothetical protein